MTILPLVFMNGHLFLKLEENLWLLDTGSQTSFGAAGSIKVAGRQFRIEAGSFGFTNTTLSRFVGVPCIGLLGTDVLGQFEHILDTVNGTHTISSSELKHSGRPVQLSWFMGIPLLTARIAGTDYRMFFDTGAQISYFHGDSLTSFPFAGCVTDFYPGAGQFQTETYNVDAALEGIVFKVQCGTLPAFLAATLMTADSRGIIGNQILINRNIGFFPGRSVLYL